MKSPISRVLEAFVSQQFGFEDAHTNWVQKDEFIPNGCYIGTSSNQ